MSLIAAGAIAAGTALSGLIGSAAQNSASKSISKENLRFQRENLDYQKALQQQIFNREDTAVQRRMQDLRAAGLNPYLATGQSADAGQVVSTSPLQNTYKPDYSQAVQGSQAGLLNGIGAYFDFKMAEQQIKERKAITEYYEKLGVGQRLKNDDLFNNLLNDWGYFSNGETFGYTKANKYFGTVEEWLTNPSYRLKQLGIEMANTQSNLLSKERDWYVADKIESYLMDTIDKALDFSSFKRALDKDRWDRLPHGYDESYSRNRSGYTRSRNYY